MTDQVQHLIDRIRSEAVAAAETQAAAILQQARDEAKRTTEAAAQRAGATVAEAEQKAAALVERGGATLQQAARDLLIAVGHRLQAMVDALLVGAAREALRPEVIEQMLLRLCEGLARTGLDDKSVAVVVSPGDKDQIARFALGKLRERMQQGVEVHIDQHLQHGFRLTFGGDTVRHDFTPAAIAAALAQFVRPQLGEVILRAAAQVPGREPAAGGGGLHAGGRQAAGKQPSGKP
jgi:V/A-type H+-transporting ATPase subunit E